MNNLNDLILPKEKGETSLIFGDGILHYSLLHDKILYEVLVLFDEEKISIEQIRTDEGHDLGYDDNPTLFNKLYSIVYNLLIKDSM